MKRAKRIVLLSALGFLFLGMPLHYWHLDRHAVLRALFAIQAPVAKASASCSTDAPVWLSKISEHGISKLKALSTQLAFVDRNGQLFHCESGWKSTMFFSGRVNKDTRFRYGSLTKPITASRILTLIEENKLELDSTLGDLFSVPDGMGGIDRVTVGQLLSHRSGIKGNIFINKTEPICPYSLQDLIASGELSSNGHFRYSNLGYCILGEVIAVVTDLPYRSSMEDTYQLSRRNISYARYEEADDEVERDFRYNDFYGRNLKGRFDYWAISSSAGMTGSASAYALLMGDLIDKVGNNLFRNEGCKSLDFKQCYGYAFYKYSPSADKVYHVKEGYLPGASGVVVINKDREILVWLGNSDTENAAEGKNMMGFLSELAQLGF